MKTSIATVSIPGTLPEKLEAIAGAGFDGIEIFEQDFIADERTPTEIGELIRSHGLELFLFQPFRDFEGLTGQLREKAFDRAKSKLDIMAELGCELMLVCSSVHPEATGDAQLAAADLAELGELAATRGMRIGYEALAWGRHVNDHRTAWEIVQAADHPNVGLVLDSFHSLSRGIASSSIRDIPADRIFFVQLADAPAIDMDLLYLSRHFRSMPGEGDLPVVDFMREVAATGYDGPVSLEIFNDLFRRGIAKGLARDGRRSITYLLDQAQGALASGSAPSLPARIQTKGIAFIEFATSDEEAPQLRSLLRGMGFVHAGDHISKKVSVWQQGEIRFVINTDPDGFARTSFINHGTNVCDVGLRVADSQSTVRRASAMGAETFSQPVGPGEFHIPAIRGVGGGLLHFIDDLSGLTRVWEVEFNSPEEEDPREPAISKEFASEVVGLHAVDHLAETMNYDEMLSWGLFYTSIFEMEKSPVVDVTDPDGLIRSQAVEAADQSLRITLNGAETHRTLAGHFLADNLGDGVQHIALATDDIIRAADTMAARGFEALPMPPNYYRDLAARFDLPAERLKDLESRSILYDEDANGRFYQFYSRPFGAGLFFEIVERRDGYRGYGGPNAPFRTAALKRYLRPNTVPKY